MVCESGSWAGSIVKPHSLQNTGDPVCVGLFSTDIWCWHDWDDNMEQRVNEVQFVLEDSPAVSSVHLKPLSLSCSDIFYNIFLFLHRDLAFRLGAHHLITPERAKSR